MGLQTVVIVDGLSILDAATTAAVKLRPDDTLIFSVFGITDCVDMADGKGGIRHVHWFSGKAADMKTGIERRQNNNSFGGFIYATALPDAPHVLRHCKELTLVSAGSPPQVLKIG